MAACTSKHDHPKINIILKEKGMKRFKSIESNVLEITFWC
uniref:Uncharacterized protein n=1 Tax=Arundo donax TaxID=35708 RepID=A0A0A8Y1Y2_ARUDO